MRLALVLTALLLGIPGAAPQSTGVLRIRIVLTDPAGQATPVSRHMLLISDNPATAPPREVVTKADGTADVKLPPGNYTVESDRPAMFQGKAYQWRQMLDVRADREAVLELTLGNAEVASAPSGSSMSAAPAEFDRSALLAQWQDSVVALWTPTRRATGFLFDARGLIATNQRVIGAATTAVEVQISPEVKVAARVLASDPARNVTVLWIDPGVIAAVRPVPLGCGDATQPPVAKGQKLFTIGAPLRDPKAVTPGTVSIVSRQSMVADFILERDTEGGPVFAGNDLVGITSIEDEAESRQGDSRITRTEAMCEVVALAETEMKGAPPAATRLPVEPVRPFPVDALEEAARRPATSPSRYQVSSSDFDVLFITPVLTYVEQHKERERGGDPGRSVSMTDPRQALVRPLTDFGNWSEYLEDFPPVLLVRATPRMVEGFWTMVGRGAAQTQGVSLPPMKRFKPGFSRMRAFCGETEVTPIHPFVIERQLTGTDAIREGLYVFDPGALGPECGPVKLVLYSEKTPEKGDAAVVDPKVIQQTWQDFAPYRTVK
jgi:hypothetical protein